ncbi:type VI secretion protein [Streptomyces sp. RerS4]|uniref:type VI secretion protein n=1 Tax=Streptomyces sp. RerS4 TaxID=2942449 RepID=UPI00201C87DA|nr:type VI secretion protein [Streptomyces sp. RerS4]UQX02182.1 type VI secretion protein [Streptomyces sp. RerS4]
MSDTSRTQPPARGGGIPDGLLVGLLAFLLGLAVLVWSATGLAAFFTKGAWPDTVTFTRTPGAVRALIAQPHDLAAAWPDTDPAALSGWGLFWGLLISQLLILLVLTIFTLGIIARTKARRRHPARTAAPASTPAPAPAPTAAPTPAAAHSPAPPQIPSPTPAAAPTTAAAPTPPPAPVSLPIPPQDPKPAAPATAPTPASTPMDEAYRYGFGYAPARPAAPLTTLTTPTPERLTYAPPAERHHLAAQAIASAEGAALVVTSSPALWAETKDARAKLGPVLLYDPSHLCDTPARMHWNPTEGCADRDTAAARAIALLAPVRPQARLDSALADTAETLLRSWLQAAAIGGLPFKQLARWAQGNGSQDPVRILRTHPQAAAGAAGELESALTAHPERREQAQHLTARALSCLTSIHIREACNPNRADALTLASFLTEGGTLYVVGEALEDPRTHPGAMPLLTALAADVVDRGRRTAARSSGSRLTPPLTLVLEDVAAVAPVPQLPDLLQDDTLPLLSLCRSREQARTRWPQATFA